MAGTSLMEAHPPGLAPGREFCTTHWSVVMAAGGEPSPHAREAMERLCRAYWYPLYMYVRHSGHEPEEAQDLTQEFFLRFIERNLVRQADRERGKFRSFLLVSLKHFLANEWARAHTAKHGGRNGVVSLELEAAEGRFQREPVTDLTPERLYEKRWALTLLEGALERLRTEYTAAGHTLLFDRLHGVVWGEGGEQPYDLLGQELGLSETAVKSAAHRLRQRYRHLLREEVSHTVASLADVDDELRYLARMMAS